MASRSFFPSEVDVGGSLISRVAWFRGAVAVMNGQPLGEKVPWTGQDPNNGKDVIVHLGADVALDETIHLAGGISALHGKGFHAGTDATKGVMTWTDSNENLKVEPTEITATPAQAATPSQSFSRWLTGFDLRGEFSWDLGKTVVLGEAYLGSNMDRGIYHSDPVALSRDTRQVGGYVGFYHETPRIGILEHAVAGYRFDAYDPNSDLFDTRGGKPIPIEQRLTAHSLMLGAQVDHARVVLQYDFNSNFLARTSLGVPTSLDADTFTVRLQVQP